MSPNVARFVFMTGKAIAILLQWLIYLFSLAMIRSKSVWVFGSFSGTFSDNSKYLFLRTTLTRSDITAVWISTSDATVDLVRGYGLRAYKRWAPLGVWYSLLAGVYVYSAYLSDINFWLSGRATRVNLWHGAPLKRIERDISSGPLWKRYHGSSYQKLRTATRHPHFYAVPDFVLAPSPFLANTLVRAMGARPDVAIAAAYPRFDAVIRSNEADPYQKVLDRETGIVANRVFSCTDGLRVLYAPTWRDGSPQMFDDIPLEWEALDQELDVLGVTIFLKLHSNSKHPDRTVFSDAKRLRYLEGISDVYPILAEFDALITDYSSIYFDFLLTDKPIIFFPYDMKTYVSSSRTFYFDYATMTPGPKVVTQREFVHALGNLRNDSFSSGRHRVRHVIWGDCEQDALSSLINALKNVRN